MTAALLPDRFEVHARPRGSDGPWSRCVGPFRTFEEAKESADLANRLSDKRDHRAVELGDVGAARSNERATIAKLCLDLASQAGQRAKQAGKKGDKGSLGAALVEAEAFRKVARMLAPKKARKVTT